MPYDFIPEFDLLICIDYFAPDGGKLSPEIDMTNQRFRLPMLPATGRILMAAHETVWSFHRTAISVSAIGAPK